MFDFAESTPNRNALLEVVMAGGKTRVATDLAEARGAQRVLVLCPANVCGVWPYQLEEWATKDWSVCSPVGSVKKKAAQLARWIHEPGIKILILNYDIIWRGPILAQVHRFKPDALIADESQRVGGMDSKCAGAVRRISQDVSWSLLLTGTAAENSPLRWWSQMFMVDPTILGSQWSFETKVTVKKPIFVRGRGGLTRVDKVVGYKNEDWLADRLRPYVLRLDERDFDYDLPDQLHVTIPVRLSAKAMAEYGRLEKLANQEIESDGAKLEVRDCSVGARMMALCQGFDSSQGEPWKLLDDVKQRALRTLLEDMEPGPVIVIAHFHADLDAAFGIAASLHRPPFECRGGKNDIEAWKQDPNGVLVGQIRSVSLGVDLTHAHRLIFLGSNWDAEDFAQVVKRIHRPGQEHKCQYFHIVATGTRDVVMRKTVAKKRRAADELRERIREQ